jgi:tRNA pseudouridine55 synthase
MEEIINILGFNESTHPNEFIEGKVLLINKPLNWTSFDVVGKTRTLFRDIHGLKKIKVGHAGTLDPLATGLLIVCTGKATKKIDSLMGMEKEYIASVTFGATTPSFDLETEPENHADYSNVTEELIKEALMSFMGKQMQTPPVYSAIKMNGKRAYEHARKGNDIEMPQREVEFFELQLLQYSAPTAIIKVRCSKGTYIRSFANDMGAKLNCGAYLSALERSAIGQFKNIDAYSMESFEELLKIIRTI